MLGKRCLEDGYIVGLETVGEAFNNVVRNSHLYFAEHKEGMELAQLTRELANYEDEEKIVDILTKQEMAAIDKELEEAMK